MEACALELGSSRLRDADRQTRAGTLLLPQAVAVWLAIHDQDDSQRCHVSPLLKRGILYTMPSQDEHPGTRLGGHDDVYHTGPVKRTLDTKSRPSLMLTSDPRLMTLEARPDEHG